jgi:hypothetical protein
MSKEEYEQERQRLKGYLTGAIAIGALFVIGMELQTRKAA